MPVHQINVNPPDWQPPLSLGPSNNNSPAADENLPEWTPRESTYATVVTVIPDHCHSSVSTLSSSNHDICSTEHERTVAGKERDKEPDHSDCLCIPLAPFPSATILSCPAQICHCEGEESAPLLAPCYCSGSLRYVHQTCLQEWIKASDTRACELCKFTFIMHSKTKPFCEWEKLEMSALEVRKLWFTVVFHTVATLCVAWSLYVLVERSVEEALRGYVDWSFWTKLIILVIGSTGVLVFMFIQCKSYIILYRKWRAFNREIFIQNAPEKVVLPPSPTDSLPLKELGHTILPCNIDPACASQMVKPDSDAIPQRHETHMKLYVFDKLSSLEDNM